MRNLMSSVYNEDNVEDVIDIISDTVYVTKLEPTQVPVIAENVIIWMDTSLNTTKITNKDLNIY